MSKVFHDFTLDVLEKIRPFKHPEEVSHIIIRKDDLGDVAARVRSAILSLKVSCKAEMPEFEHIACLGSLDYLRTLLKSKNLSGKAEYEFRFNYQKSREDKPPTVRTINIKAGRLESLYQATNPYINNLVDGIRNPKIHEWTVLFGVDQETIAEFKDAARIHAMAPKIGGERDDIFSIGFDGETVVASFGDKGHQSSILLAEDLSENVMEPDRKISALFSIKNFSGLLEMIGKGVAVMALAPNALRIETESEMATYSAVLTAKKLVD